MAIVVSLCKSILTNIDLSIVYPQCHSWPSIFWMTYFFINLYGKVGVANKTILVIGSQNPWLEVVLLARSSLFCFVLIVLKCLALRDPKEIVTLEYGAFESGHPLWSFLRWQSWINADFDYHFDVTIKRDIFRPNEFRRLYQVNYKKVSWIVLVSRNQFIRLDNFLSLILSSLTPR